MDSSPEPSCLNTNHTDYKIILTILGGNVVCKSPFTATTP